MDVPEGGDIQYFVDQYISFGVISPRVDIHLGKVAGYSIKVSKTEIEIMPNYSKRRNKRV